MQDAFIDIEYGNDKQFKVIIWHDTYKDIFTVEKLNHMDHYLRYLSEHYNLRVDVRGPGIALAHLMEECKIKHSRIELRRY